MANSLNSTTYILPLGLQRENELYAGSLCISQATYQDLNKVSHTFLHPQEQAYLAKLEHERRRHSYLLGRYCAKRAISSYTQTQDLQSTYIKSGIFQQPITDCPAANNLQVSISHTQTIGAAIAFPEEHPMGIDIETNDCTKVDIIKTQMTTAEEKLALTFHHFGSPLTFLWTAKEALSKVLRCGFMIAMELLEIETVLPKENYIQSYFKHFHQYQALSFQFNETICSIVYPRKTQLDIDVLKIQKFCNDSHLYE